jgi:hypothetical protein
MNKAIVQQNNLQNQSLWNDDPFDLPWSSQGVTSLSHTRNLHFYAQELVLQYGKFESECYNITFSELPEFAQKELARLYLEYTDRDWTDCLNGTDYSIDNDFTCALLAMLKNDCKRTRESFAEITCKNIINHYERDLDKVLTDACHDCLEDSMNERGYSAVQSRESGDVEWRKL